MREQEHLAGCSQLSNTPCAKGQPSPRLHVPCARGHQMSMRTTCCAAMARPVAHLKSLSLPAWSGSLTELLWTVCSEVKLVQQPCPASLLPELEQQ